LDDVVRFDVGMNLLPLVEVSAIARNSRKAARASSARAAPCFAIHRHSAGPEINSSLRRCLQALYQGPWAAIVMLLALLTTGGCATLPDGHGWGQDATAIPGWHKFFHPVRFHRVNSNLVYIWIRGR
jgi:hypothetical protein